MNRVMKKLVRGVSTVVQESISRASENVDEITKIRQLWKVKDKKDYIEYIRSKSIDERLKVMDSIYKNGNLMKEYNFCKIIIEPFIGDLDTLSIKKMNLRLAHLYFKWYNFTSKYYFYLNQTLWDDFFSAHGDYYMKNWREDVGDYLLSLLFTPTAFDYSKVYKNTMNEAAAFVLRNGIPSSINNLSDCKRIMMKKLGYLTHVQSMDDLFQHFAFEYFSEIKTGCKGNFHVFMLEYILLGHKLKFDTTDIANKLNSEIEWASKKEPEKFDVLFSMLRSRCKSEATARKGLEFMKPYIKNVGDFSKETLFNYAHLFLVCWPISKPLPEHFLRVLEGILSKWFDDLNVTSILIRLKKKRFILPVPFSKKINYLLAQQEAKYDMNPQLITGKNIFEVVTLKLSSGRISPLLLSLFIEHYSSTDERLYISTMVFIARYFINRNSFDNLQFWNKFIELVADMNKLQRMGKTELVAFLKICIVLREKEIMDVISLIEKGFWDSAGRACYSYLPEQEISVFKIIEDYFRQKEVKDVYVSSIDYWLLPLAIPSCKLAFINIKSPDFYFRNIVPIAEEKGWKVVNLCTFSVALTKVVESKQILLEKLDILYDSINK
eukprot:TRINITY_DN6466_c0_g8_i1.p1 TRINITY_DN6466_c0_g8~~TRINITY_DN6466_c0_g8_i1.p1  ORF type:complete len:607 (+),score=128.06 TRINITY_DN6466_c0_g8_i1:83-1903(+)